MATTTEEHEKKFHELFQRAKYLKFGHEYAIDTCDVYREPDMCLVIQLDKKTNEMGLTLLGREGAEVFSELSPIDERLVRQYKNTKEFREKKELYIATGK